MSILRTTVEETRRSTSQVFSGKAHLTKPCVDTTKKKKHKEKAIKYWKDRKLKAIERNIQAVQTKIIQELMIG